MFICDFTSTYITRVIRVIGLTYWLQDQEIVGGSDDESNSVSSPLSILYQLAAHQGKLLPNTD